MSATRMSTDLDYADPEGRICRAAAFGFYHLDSEYCPELAIRQYRLAVYLRDPDKNCHTDELDPGQE